MTDLALIKPTEAEIAFIKRDTVVAERIIELTQMQQKNPLQLQELDILLRNTVGGGGGSNRSGRPAKKDAKRKPNFVDDISAADFDEKVKSLLFKYQLEWRRRRYHKKHYRERFYLKARQGGATYYFALEAFENAVRTGEDQVFLSASRRQADMFRHYMRSHARKMFGMELKGRDEIVLSNGAVLYFLSTRGETAQGRSGNLYIDEAAWIPGFDNFDDLVTPIATLKHFAITYFSTPSSVSHPSYKRWTGRDRDKNIDVTYAKLRKGCYCDDAVWRQTIKVHDYVKGGNKLIDIDDIKLRTKPNNWRQKFECEWLVDGDSSFKLSLLMRAHVEPEYDWKDVNLQAARPVGDRPVWIGYDPSGNGPDHSAAVVNLAPTAEYNKHRILETERWTKQTQAQQAECLKRLMLRYNVQEIVIDATGGYGEGVVQIVEEFFPLVTAFKHTVRSKDLLISKALDVFSERRIEYDRDEEDITNAFTAITTKTSEKGTTIYHTSRANGVGHGDMAWATMLAIHPEPAAYQQSQGQKSSFGI